MSHSRLWVDKYVPKTSDDIIGNEHNIKWAWVKGHSGHPGNERADQLANKGIDEL